MNHIKKHLLILSDGEVGGVYHNKCVAAVAVFGSETRLFVGIHCLEFVKLNAYTVNLIYFPALNFFLCASSQSSLFIVMRQSVYFDRYFSTG